MINLTSEEVTQALWGMKTFFHDLQDLYERHGMKLDANPGRRNNLLSAAQEHFFAEIIKTHAPEAQADGVTGRPDISLGDGRELECKLTTPIKPGMVMLQTDWSTLNKKGSLDYLYVIADNEFEKFCVVYFEGLTVNDFHPLQPSSRGKSQMKKHRAMRKARILWGSVIDSRQRDIDTARKKLLSVSDRATLTRMKLEERIRRLEIADSYYSFELHKI